MSIKNNRVGTVVISGVLIVLFFIFAALYKHSFIYQFDVSVMKNMPTLHREGLNTAFIMITNTASRPYQYGILIFFSVVWLLGERKWREPFILAVCLAGVRYGNQWLKNLFERERPSFHPIIEITGYSFPSGHAMISIAYFGIIAYFLIRNYIWLQNHKKLVYGITLLFIFLVGFSRVFLGVHYPTDVLAGFTIGGAWLLICITLYEVLRSFSKNG